MSEQPSIEDDFLITLQDLATVQISGEDASTYLQGQVTIDVAHHSAEKLRLGCHCDFKGKTWNIFYLLGQHPEFLMVSHHEALEKSVAELKKYGVFSKVTIDDNQQNWQILGGTGQATESAIQQFFGGLPNDVNSVIYNEQGYCARLSGTTKRYLIVVRKGNNSAFATNDEHAQALLEKWNSWDIQAGIANIQVNTSNEFVPQMMNMQALQAIDFDKGCYMGQEVVARTKYLGKNKRAAFVLKSHTPSEIKSGDILEVKLGENWRRGGTVLRSAQTDNETWVLAVVANDTDTCSEFRSKQTPEVQFVIEPLPYTIE